MPRLGALTAVVAAFCLSAHAQSPTIGDFQFVSETRIDRTNYLYVYRVTLHNPGPALTNVGATVSSTNANTVIVDNTLTFGNVPAGESRVSQDTFSFRHDRSTPFDANVIHFDITYSLANRPPNANAGPDQTVITGATVQLNGSGSSDPDGNPLTFSWSMTQRPTGSAAALSNTTLVNPTFVADRYGTYRVQLVVNDGMTSSVADEVVISTQNSAPVANAGPDQTVTTGSTVQLNGGASSDVDGQSLTYTWSWIGKPAGSAAALSSATAVNPTFAADRFGTYVLQLVVNDGLVSSAADQVVISTQNTAPVANAGPDQTTTVGSTVTLDGTASSDVDGQALSYTWSFVSRPSGSSAALSNANAVQPTFVVDRFGPYVIQLIVHDGTVSSAADTITVTTINSSPTANAGPDQTAHVGSVVTLDGSGSHDPDGQSLTYSWALTSRPAGSSAAISNPTSVNPTFTVDRFGVYNAQLVVNDGIGDSAPDTVQISTLNSAPVANAGPDQTVTYLSTVNLNGSASSDVDGNPLTYSWSFTNRPAGSTAALSDLTAVNPTFVADRPGTFVLQLIVNDGSVNSAADTVVITTTNSAPAANAGPDQSVSVGQLVTLDGTASSDPDSNPLTYAWSFSARPAGSLAALAGAGSTHPTFTVDVGGTYIVQLTVSDGLLTSPADSVMISTGNVPPVANAGPDQTGILVGDSVQLDGSASSDPDHNVLTYSWSLSTKPSGSAAALSGTTLANPTFVADRRGTYVAQLIVNDGLVNSPSDTVVITTANRAPVANAGPDQTGIDAGTVVNLNGSGSSDPDGDTLTYSWAFVQRPSGSASSLTGSNTATPSFTPDRGGLYRVQLVVNDGLTSSAADTVDITVNNRAPVANAGPDQTNVVVGTTANLNGAASSDPDGNPLTYAWSFTSRPTGSSATLSAPTSATPSFVPDLPGTYELQLVVNDGFVNSAPDTVQIAVTGGTTTLSLVDTGLIRVGGSATLLLSISPAAPIGGLTVTISSDAPSLVSVGPPISVTIAQGASTGTVVLNGVGLGSTAVHSDASGYAPGTLNVSTTNNILTLPATLNVPLGQTAAMPINLSPAAPAAVTVTVTSSDPGKVEVLTPSVSIGAGEVVGNISLRGAAPGSATILATVPGYASSSSTATTTASFNIVETSRTMTPGFPVSMTVQLESGGVALAAPSPGMGFNVTAADTGCVSNGSGTIPTGLVNTSFPLAYGGTASLPCTTSVTVSATGITSDSISVTVNQNPGITLTNSGTNQKVGASLQIGGSGTLGFAAHGGRTVHLTSSDPTLFKLSTSASAAATSSMDIAVADGDTTFNFVIQGQDNMTGSGTLTATTNGFSSGSVAVNVVTPVLRVHSLGTSYSWQDADVPFYVDTGIPTADGSGLGQAQAVRSELTLTVTLTNSSSTAARLTTLLGSDQTRTVSIPGGSSSSPTTVAAGGVAFDPLAGGTTTVSASAPNFLSIPVSSVTVNVTGGTISLSSLPITVGAGLMRSGGSATLSGTSHGGVTVRIASSDPALVKVSPNTSTPGTDFFEQYVPNGTATVNFYAHAMEGVAGTATVTATAATFSDGSGTVNVVPFTAELQSLAASQNVLDANDAFYVRVGLSNTAHTSFSEAQSVRAGSAGITFTLSNSQATVGQLVTTAGAGQTRTVSIAAGSSTSPDTVAGGGVALDPLGVGTTTVAISAPDIVVIPTSSLVVNVAAGSMSITSSATVGAGLMKGSQGVTLSGGNHGGVDVTVTSGNSSLVLLSLDSATEGADHIVKHLNDGVTSFNYVVHGVEGGIGPVTLTATAANFSDATGTVNVVTPTVDIMSLTTPTTSLSADDPFTIRCGIPNVARTAIADFQWARAGHPISFTVTNSDATIAQLTTSSGTAQSRTVVMAPGTHTSPGSVAAGGIAFDPIGGGSTTVSATAPGFSAIDASSIVVNVSSPGISISGLPKNVGSGLMTGSCCSAVLGGSSHGGVTMRISSSNPGVIKVSPNTATAGTDFFDQAVPDGSTTVSFVLHGMEGATGTVTITAHAPGFTDGTRTATAVRPVVDLWSLGATQNVFSPNDAFQLRVGIGSPNLTEEQSVRAGSAGFTFSISNGDSSVGQLRTTAGNAQAVNITVAAGSARSPATVAAGGVEFDPLAAGSTTVTAANPAFDTLAAGAPTITVTPGSLSVTAPSVAVGQGLMRTGGSVTLSGSNHGGVTITISSGAPDRLVVSPDTATVGSASFSVVVPDGTNSVSYVIHGIETGLGASVITASGTNFTSGSATANVTTAGIEIGSLAATHSVAGANDPFIARVGLPNVGNTALSEAQAVRAGSPGVVVTLTSTNAPVAQLVTTAGGAATQIVAIAAGQSGSPATVAAGGVAFDPLSVGTTFVQAAAAGFTPMNPGANQQIVVN